MIKMKIRYLVVTLVTIHFSLLMPHLAWAQPKVMQLIKQMPSYASCNYHVYPDSITTPLTPVGRKVLHEMNLIMQDTENRWGELTGYGKKQLQQIGRRIAERFPEVL